MPNAKVRKIERSLAAMHRVVTHVDSDLGASRATCVGTATEVVGDGVRPVPRAVAVAERPASLTPRGQVGRDPVMSGRHSAGGCIGRGGLGPQATDDDSWWS